MANTLNFFEQPDPTNDNPLVLNGTVSGSTADQLKSVLVTLFIGSVSASGDFYIAPGVAGTIVRISSIIDAVPNGVLSTLDFDISGTPINNSSIAIFAGESAGSVRQSTPSALNVVSESDYIRVVKTGGSGVTSNAVLTFEIVLD